MSVRLLSFQNVLNSLVFRDDVYKAQSASRLTYCQVSEAEFVRPRTQRERNVVRSINQSINHLF